MRVCARCIRVIPGPPCFYGRSFGLLGGKFDFLKLFLGVLTVSDMFSDLLKSFSMSCACLHVSDASI